MGWGSDGGGMGDGGKVKGARGEEAVGIGFVI